MRKIFISFSGITRSAKRLLIVMWAILLVGVTPVALAVDYDSQINALQNQIKQNQGAANQKRSEANTLANRVASLNAEISAAQGALNLTRTEISKTTAEIAAQNAELTKQTTNLKANLAAMYKDRDVSPIEVLASSDNLSDFVGKQQYMTDLKDKIESSIASITRIKADLEKKNADLAVKADNEKGQVEQIARKRSEVQVLLAQTRGEEAAYQSQVAQNQAQLNSVIAARAEEIRRQNIRSTVGGCGGYPGNWCTAVQDSMVDDWGYYNRECVSYVAWKRWATGRWVPTYWGNAGDWYWRGSNISPQTGDIVVWPYGSMSPWGHVAYVESNAGGIVTISEFNYAARGTYGTRSIPLGSSMLAGARFIR